MRPEVEVSPFSGVQINLYGSEKMSFRYALFFVSLLVPAVSIAEPVSKQALEECRAESAVARGFANDRQNGVPMSEAMTKASNMKDAGIAQLLVEFAYGSPRRDSQKDREREAERIEEMIYSHCYKQAKTPG